MRGLRCHACGTLRPLSPLSVGFLMCTLEHVSSVFFEMEENASVTQEEESLEDVLKDLLGDNQDSGLSHGRNFARSTSVQNMPSQSFSRQGEFIRDGHNSQQVSTNRVTSNRLALGTGQSRMVVDLANNAKDTNESATVSQTAVYEDGYGDTALTNMGRQADTEQERIGLVDRRRQGDATQTGSAEAQLTTTVPFDSSVPANEPASKPLSRASVRESLGQRDANKAHDHDGDHPIDAAIPQPSSQAGENDRNAIQDMGEFWKAYDANDERLKKVLTSDLAASVDRRTKEEEDWSPHDRDGHESRRKKPTQTRARPCSLRDVARNLRDDSSSDRQGKNEATTMSKSDSNDSGKAYVGKITDSSSRSSSDRAIRSDHRDSTDRRDRISGRRSSSSRSSSSSSSSRSSSRNSRIGRNSSSR
eukprot:TRINITY_DN4543_c1_g1_i1.p1 TRINITY_DN4543_c1_g1~~TRINITY_DN4543_c1_g1_i1.p1  ORF type:complete len:418 (+),score=74.97 TRINITY_DN4543_c1_g1_i1:162-1415(+)